MRFFSKKAFARHMTAQGDVDWKALWSDYKAHLDSIRPRLSASWQRLAEEDFHDQRIIAIERPSKCEFVMVLESATLKFLGVHFVWVPGTAINDCWVYWEVAPSDDKGVNLVICLAHDEIRIVADDVEISRATPPKRPRTHSVHSPRRRVARAHS